MEWYETSVGVLGRIGVWTDLAGPSSVVLLTVLVFVDVCKSLVFLAAGTDPVSSPLLPASHCPMTSLSSFVMEQLLVLIAGDGGNGVGGAFPGDTIEMIIASLLMGLGGCPTRLCVCGVSVSFSSLSSMIS